MGDRPFQRTLYSKFGSFHRILDVGVRGYNRHCRDYIRQSAEDIAAATNTTNIYSSGSHITINNNNKTIIYPQYYQMEPFPPNNETLNNDGLLQCYLHQVPHKYPNMKHSFDLIIDFGVFGWDAVQSSFSEEDVRRYIQSVLFLLKEKTKSDTYNGLWVLKVDRGWVANQEEFFKEFILPYFDFGRFEEWESGYALKNGNFRFYFLYRK
ncbi:hypothetical protein ACHAWO_007091 [Cyclotella atomus]|jgi:hypothetical protein|uniref:Methyltransferase type 11 domain-containing protein n=1 Tax=Cyclotella atomus TaxID=382360 RepID=A0ABD3QKL8_9STRA